MRGSTLLAPVGCLVLVATWVRPIAPAVPEGDRFLGSVVAESRAGGAGGGAIPVRVVRANECADGDAQITGSVLRTHARSLTVLATWRFSDPRPAPSASP